MSKATMFRSPQFRKMVSKAVGGHMIETFKIMHEMNKVDREKSFSFLHNTRTRRNLLILSGGELEQPKENIYPAHN